MGASVSQNKNAIELAASDDQDEPMPAVDYIWFVNPDGTIGRATRDALLAGEAEMYDQK